MSSDEAEAAEDCGGEKNEGSCLDFYSPDCRSGERPDDLELHRRQKSLEAELRRGKRGSRPRTFSISDGPSLS